ncbi:uncharacterized protein LOC107606565 [Arachis ipaensis]|nr:uncharacterized protein LOC107606565 [Arachis ipaensis]
MQKQNRKQMQKKKQIQNHRQLVGDGATAAEQIGGGRNPAQPQIPLSLSFARCPPRVGLPFTATHSTAAEACMNDDDVFLYSRLPSPSLVAKANFSCRIFTRYSSPSEVTFTADNPMELALASSALLQSQLSRQNSSGMVLEPFRKGRVVTFWDNFDDEEQDDVGGSRADGSRTLSAREAVAAQETAEVAVAGEVVGEGEEDKVVQPVMMPLIDLFEETDKEMRLEGLRYILSDDEEFDEDGDGDDLKYRLYNRGY